MGSIPRCICRCAHDAQPVDKMSLSYATRNFRECSFRSHIPAMSRRDTSRGVNFRGPICARIPLFSNLYSQLDPVAIGEDYRDLHVALDYGHRLASHSGNLKPGAVSDLVHKYPSHDFVIDEGEAKTLFKTVNVPPQEIFELLELLGALAMKPLTDEDGVFKFLSEDVEQVAVNSVSPSVTKGDQDDAAIQPDA